MHAPEEELNFRAAKRVEVLITAILSDKVPLPPITPSVEDVRKLTCKAIDARLTASGHAASVPKPVLMSDESVHAVGQTDSDDKKSV